MATSVHVEVVTLAGKCERHEGHVVLDELSIPLAFTRMRGCLTPRPKELARGEAGTERRAEVPGGLDELAGSEARTHHPCGLPACGERKLVEANASGDAGRLRIAGTGVWQGRR